MLYAWCYVMSVTRVSNIHYTQICKCSLLDHDDYGIETAVKTDGTVSYDYPTSDRLKGELRKKTCRGAAPDHHKQIEMHLAYP